jgi:hypothetical protein
MADRSFTAPPMLERFVCPMVVPLRLCSEPSEVSDVAMLGGTLFRPAPTWGFHFARCAARDAARGQG